MLNLPHSLIIETTDDPAFFCFYSPTLPGFTGAATSLSDCVEQAGPAMLEFRDYLAEFGSPVPPPDERPVVLICDEPAPSAIPAIDWDNDEFDPAADRPARNDPAPESAGTPPTLAAA